MLHKTGLYAGKRALGCSFLLLSFSTNCHSGIDDMRAEADMLYKKSNYLKAEEVWKKILEEEQKTPEDMRKAASVYYQNKKYENSLNIYKELVNTKKNNFSDLKNLLFSFERLEIDKKNEFKDQIKEAILLASHQIISNPYSGEYEHRIANNALKWAETQEIDNKESPFSEKKATKYKSQLSRSLDPAETTTSTTIAMSLDNIDFHEGEKISIYQEKKDVHDQQKIEQHLASAENDREQGRESLAQYHYEEAEKIVREQDDRRIAYNLAGKEKEAAKKTINKEKDKADPKGKDKDKYDDKDISAEEKGFWSEESETFVNGALISSLRNSRAYINRPKFSFRNAIDILDFIEKEKTTYGVDAISESSEFNKLMVDICDIVNLCHPDFKKKYNIFIEQWLKDNKKSTKKGTQLPFSFFSFDKIAQVFHYSADLFNQAPNSEYKQKIRRILNNEFGQLINIFYLIQDIENIRINSSSPVLGNHGKSQSDLIDLNAHLEKIILKTGTEKANEQEEVRKKIESPNLYGLWLLSSMAHDYLTLGRLEESINMVLTIPTFKNPEHIEAFLAGIAQIGELSTNKNLSHFVQRQIPTIPWKDLVHCRDAIQHQDEHGFDAYFKHLVDGSNSSINFQEWQNELKLLLQKTSTTKNNIWGDTPADVFEIWLKKESEGTPIYAAIAGKPNSISLDQFDKRVKKAFRQTPVWKQNSSLWSELTKGNAKIERKNLQELRDAIENLKHNIPTIQDQKFLVSYECVEDYLWDRMWDQATHLKDNEKNTLINFSKDHFNIIDISSFCFNILNNRQKYLTKENGNLFVSAAAAARLNFRPILPIFTNLRQEMMVTRQVCQALPFDTSKDLTQDARKELAKRMFARTTEHLHELSHGPNFQARLMQEAMTIPARFCFEKAVSRDPKIKELEQKMARFHETHGVTDEYGYSNLTPEGNLFWTKEIMESGLKFDFPEMTPEYKEFGKEVINRFYVSAHKVHLPTAIKTKPTTYLASVYSLSVGIGALKGWVQREHLSPPATEAMAVEALREGRNFLAHGDILRSMHSINLSEIQEYLLTDHLEYCEKLDF